VDRPAAPTGSTPWARRRRAAAKRVRGGILESDSLRPAVEEEAGGARDQQHPWRGRLDSGSATGAAFAQATVRSALVDVIARP